MRASTTRPVFEPSSRLHELSAEEAALYRQLDPLKIPQHVAIIMDGNGRWAGKRALLVTEEPLQGAFAGPAAIAVHDDSDVLRNFEGI